MSLARHSRTALAPSVSEPPPRVTIRSAPASRAASAAAITAWRGVCGGIRSNSPAQRLPRACCTLATSSVVRPSVPLTIRNTRAAAPPRQRSRRRGGRTPPPPWRRTRCGRIAPSPRLPSAVEPDVLHPIAVVDAVDHRRQPLDVRLDAGAAARIEDDRAGALLGELALDLPDDLLALAGIGLGRLRVDHPVDLAVAIAGVVAHRAAHEVLVELLVGVVDAALGAVDRDR